MSERTCSASTLARALASSGSASVGSAGPARPWPTVHARCIGSHAAMSDRDTTCPPQRPKPFRHPDSLLAWAVHPLTVKACLCTQSTSLPPLHTCMQLCHSRGWKTLGQSQSIEDPQKYEWLAQLQNRNTNHHGCTATTAASCYDTNSVIDHALSHCPPALVAHCFTNRTRRTQQPTTVTKSARPTAPSQRPADQARPSQTRPGPSTRHIVITAAGSYNNDQ